MKLGVVFAAFGGLALAILLLAYYGFAAVAQSMLTVGWGLLVISLYHIVTLSLSALAWQSVTRPVWGGKLAIFIWARAVREGVANLLPVLHVGGELVGARILTVHGAAAGTAGASVVVDLTLEAAAQFAFTLLGFTLLLMLGGSVQAVRWAVVGLLAAALVLCGFVIAQRRGLFLLLERFLQDIADRWQWPSLGRVDDLHATIETLYRHRRALAISGFWHVVSWIVSTGEIWIALDFMGHPVDFAQALVIESLSHAIRSMAFAIPGALGVQEGAYVLIGALFGLNAEIALALSLVKRVRDLLLGLPALAGWQLFEGRRIWSGRERRL